MDLKGYSIRAEYFQILALLISPKNMLPSLELHKIIHAPNYIENHNIICKTKGKTNITLIPSLWEFGIA